MKVLLHVDNTFSPLITSSFSLKLIISEDISVNFTINFDFIIFHSYQSLSVLQMHLSLLETLIILGASPLNNGPNFFISGFTTNF